MQDLQQLCHGPVPDPQEPTHVRLIPDQLPRRPRAAHHVEVVGVGQQLQDVAADERAVRLGQDDDVAA